MRSAGPTTFKIPVLLLPPPPLRSAPHPHRHNPNRARPAHRVFASQQNPRLQAVDFVLAAGRQTCARMRRQSVAVLVLHHRTGNDAIAAGSVAGSVIDQHRSCHRRWFDAHTGGCCLRCLQQCARCYQKCDCSQAAANTVADIVATIAIDQNAATAPGDGYCPPETDAQIRRFE